MNISLVSFFTLIAVLRGVIAQDQIDCPDGTLTTYLLALIDTLYDNGLTIFEELIAHISETDEGYALLDQWYREESITLLVPTDSAFQSAGIWSPFGDQSNSSLVDMVALHTLKGSWSWNSLPASPQHGVASSQLSLAVYANSTVNSTADQAVVMEQEANNVLVIKMANANSTSWNGALSISSPLTNIIILPIDTIIAFPPSLSEALNMSTTSRSVNRLGKLSSAISTVSSTGPAALEPIALGGFTIFAPVDDAWKSDAENQVGNKTIAPTLLANHYSTNYSLFSPMWSTNANSTTIKVDSGESLTVGWDGSSNYVSLASQKANILRADVTLENGVMHIIDTVLLGPSTESTTSDGAGASGLLGNSPPSTASGTNASGGVKAAASATSKSVKSSAERKDIGVGKWMTLSLSMGYLLMRHFLL